jgi:DNA-binding transcriptional MerR regulator
MRTHAEARRDTGRTLQLFEPDPDAVYTIDATARFASVPRRTIVVYCKHGLVSPAADTADTGYYFNRDGIRALLRIEALRAVCGNDLAGIRLILELLKEVERLQREVRSCAHESQSDKAKE